MSVADPLWNHSRDISEVAPCLLKEVEHFFAVYKDLEEKKVGIEGWENREVALRVIAESVALYGGSE